MNESDFKPSIAIEWVADCDVEFWKYLGSMVASIIGLLEKIWFIWDYIRDFVARHFRELGETFYALVDPIWKFCVSWFWFFEGYWEVVDQYEYPITVFISMLTLLGGCLWLCTRVCCGCCRRKKKKMF
uniref:Transmembrane protein n=1 Tax=Mimivirus LCMiAC01 TaxID=2506608 RepID=A0A481Z0M6_9VIRU|nr:MAG: hypothetical protein LCMiAC01_04920 [Mimivirus LCMiAC01]